jgi:hypothetical protein
LRKNVLAIVPQFHDGGGMNLKKAVNAKTPRSKGARDREMTREERTHPAGNGTQQPKPLRLCTFAPLR